MTDLTINNLRETLAGFIAPTLVERRDEALREANTDALTGLGNRAAFNRALPTVSRDESFIVFDLNNFKKTNDVVGHSAGDLLLKTYADVIANVARKFKARAFRYGGDEFVIIANRLFVERVRDAVEKRALPVCFPGFEASISGAVGSTFDEADVTLQARKADRKARS